MNAAVIVNDVSKEFGHARPGAPTGKPARWSIQPPRSPEMAAVEHLSFSIAVGEIFGLVGPSGSGKTTLIRMLAGHILPDQGEVRLFGCDLTRQSAQAQRMTNRILGEASFFKRLSALDNLMVGAQQYGLGGSEIRRQAGDLLARLGVDAETAQAPLDWASRPALQKVSIARALLARPRLLLLDDPVRGLSPAEKRQALQVIGEESQSAGLTVALAARDWLDAAHIADRIALLDHGRLVDIHTLNEPIEAAAPLESWPAPFAAQAIEA